MRLSSFRLRMGSTLSKYLPPISVGTLIYSIVFGYKKLLTWNLAWLSQGENQDMIQHYFGWAFFRNSPWQFPLGLNSNYGIGIRNSIVYTDSIPLLAFLFKPFSPILPETFQYFGIWLLICFVLQSVFAWRLVTIFTENRIVLLSASLIFLFSPIMLMRANLHFALVGQFIILAALGNYFSHKENANSWKWRLTLFAAILIHAYLFAMVFSIWVASILRCKRNTTVIRRSLETLAVLTLTTWLAGYFVIPFGGEVFSGHYGIFRWNIASFVYPDGWSTLMSPVTANKINVENSSYLGLGVIIAILFIFSLRYRDLRKLARKVRDHLALSIVFLLLACFAISNNVGLGPIKLQFALPPLLLRLFDPFRSSGRMIWPVVYSLILLTIVLISRSVSSKWASTMLMCLALIQVVDTWQGWNSLGREVKVSKDLGVEVDSRWKFITQKYDEIVVIPSGNQSENWIKIGAIASSLGLSTNSVYLSRIEPADVMSMATDIENEIRSCNLIPRRIYVLNETELAELCKSNESNRFSIQRIDGFNVVLPNTPRTRGT